jgi:SAM-dependent methyltransferase
MSIAMEPPSEARIVASWTRNVSQWTRSVRQQQIESRTLVTNQAIVDAIVQQSPHALLDIGCGEGWLIRALAPHVSTRIGVDAVPGLIERARAAGGGDFRVASYADLARGALLEPVDLAVCNFSLFGEHSVEQLIAAHASFLRPAGVLLVHTLHPHLASAGLPYRDGWREGSWDGFDPAFVDAAPWYFRTLESWVRLFTCHGLRLLEMREPIHPRTGRPASVLFVAQSPATATAAAPTVAG